MTVLADFYQDLIVCENYEIAKNAGICKILDRGYDLIFNKFGLAHFIDQWAVQILIILFICFISMMVFYSFIEDQLSLKDVHCKIRSNWSAILNLVYAVNLTDELTTRNEALKLQAIQNKIILKNIKTNDKNLKEVKKPVNEQCTSSDSTSTLEISNSTISSFSPRLKKPKLDKDSGNESNSLSDNESRNHIEPLNLIFLPTKKQGFIEDSDKIVAPPSSPVSGPTTPKLKKEAIDMNIYSISEGIFEERKSFFENTKLKSMDKLDSCKKLVIFVEGNESMKHTKYKSY